ncbi:conserved hypothetical protein [Magnetococcus marinus MC-1]|uniref:DUF4340 domain-containing protein n=1 Tax=Magnetococcus marinus (strain ATCC BAA-1437 / JCM 17883 / MC-1) TaxID=156889 RepID=A0L4K7_MAGMM|nr:DUF4340 domain-containing protein [Magnetococcus marinus]ABK42900.1 conserved hypothetical protein [Magnetococcus marinus MC-1]
MARNIRILALLLAAQMGLALVLLGSGPSLQAVNPNTPLLNLGEGELDELLIEGDDHSQLLLKKQDGLWRLPDHHNYPAEQGDVTALLSQLKSLSHGTPMATSDAALERFKVADTHFNRRITLKRQQQVVAVLYLGSGQGARNSAAHVEGQPGIFNVAIALHQVPQTAKAWQDKTLLQIPAGEIMQIATHGLTLQRQPVDKEDKAAKPSWQATGLQAGETVNSTAVESLSTKLATLRIEELLGVTDQPAYGLDKPVWQATLTRQGQPPLIYQLGHQSEPNSYTLKRSDRPEYFKLPTYLAESLIEAGKRDSLLNKAP